MQEKTDRVLTVFKLTQELKNKAKDTARTKKISFSELLTDKLDELLKAKVSPEIPQLKKGKTEMKPTSVLLPREILKASRHMSIEQHVSLADIFRYCLNK